MVLGEMFSCGYSHSAFTASAEIIGDVGTQPHTRPESVTSFLSSAARDLGLWIVGGSVPELVKTKDSSKLYNTCVVFDSTGRITAKYRKLHLFDVSVPGDVHYGKPAVEFRESDTLTSGDLGLCLFETPWDFQIGLGICYDLRFPELSTALRNRSKDRMKLLIFPGQFSLTTGPLHWELLGRARAVDTESFCILASTARPNDRSMFQV